MKTLLLTAMVPVPWAGFAADGSENTIVGPARITGTLDGDTIDGNWVATPAQAQQGTRNDLIMTPAATQAALAALVARLAPSQSNINLPDMAVPTGFVMAVKE